VYCRNYFYVPMREARSLAFHPKLGMLRAIEASAGNFFLFLLVLRDVNSLFISKTPREARAANEISV
jgi:hypothetical protein